MSDLSSSTMLQAGAAASSAQSPPSHNRPPQLRDKIVEILSGTANGCLSELGYYPGMFKKIKELELSKAQWQAENMKLYQDNRNLALMLQAQNERVLLLSKPDNDQLISLGRLQEENFHLRQEKDELLRWKLGTGGPTVSLAEFEQLRTQFQQLSQELAVSKNENQRLCTLINSLLRPPPDPQTAQSPTSGSQHYPKQCINPLQTQTVQREHRTVQPAASMPQIVPTATSIPQTQRMFAMQHYRQQQSAMMFQASSSSPTTPGQVPNHSRTQGAKIRHTSRNSVSSISAVASSSSQPVPGNASQHNAPHDKRLQKFQNTMSIVDAWNSSNVPRSSMHQNLQTSLARATERHQPSQGTSADTLPKLSHIPTSGSPSVIPVSPFLQRSPVVHPSFFIPTMEIPNQSVPLSSAVAVANANQPTVSRAIALNDPPPHLLPTPPASTALGRTPELRLSWPSAELPTVVSSPRKLSESVETLSSPSSSRKSSPSEPVEATTPKDMTLNEQVEVVASPVIGGESTKRANSEMSEGVVESASRKKPRLSEETEDTQLDLQLCNELMEVVVEGETKEEEEEDEDSDEEIEVGPDGLRLVEDCVAMLIEEAEDNPDLKTCLLCNGRYNEGFVPEPPKPMVRPTQEELVQHLSIEHEDAWDTVRLVEAV